MERRERHRIQLGELRAVCAHRPRACAAARRRSAHARTDAARCTLGRGLREGACPGRIDLRATVRRHPRRPAAGQAVGKVGIQTHACTLRAEAQRRIAHEHVIDVRTEHGRRIEDIA